MANPEETGASSRLLRGDAVGDTMYSERWVLQQLIKLTKYISDEVKFCVEFENDLCTLWDMCAEKDVIRLTRKHGLISLTINTIMKSDSPRLSEIMVGILGNMCTLKSVREECKRRSDIINVMMELLAFPDSPTLIQVMRVLQTFAWEVSNSTMPSPHGQGSEDGEEIQNDHEEIDPQNYEENFAPVRVRHVGGYDSEVNGGNISNDNVVLQDETGSNIMSEESSLSDDVDEELEVLPTNCNESATKKEENSSRVVAHCFKNEDQISEKNLGITKVKQLEENEITATSKCAGTMFKDTGEKEGNIENITKTKEERHKSGSEKEDVMVVLKCVEQNRRSKANCESEGMRVAPNSECTNKNRFPMCSSDVESSETCSKKRFLNVASHTGDLIISDSPESSPGKRSVEADSEEVIILDSPDNLNENKSTNASEPLADTLLEEPGPSNTSALEECVAGPSGNVASTSRTGWEEMTGEGDDDDDENPEVVDVPAENESVICSTSMLWYEQFLNVEKWLPEVVYILNSSKSAELIDQTWSLLSILCYLRVGDTFLCCTISGADMLRGLLESFKEFFSQHADLRNAEIYDISKCRKGLIVWTTVMYSFTFHDDCDNICSVFKGDIMRHIFQMLTFFNHFLPLDEELREYLIHTFAILEHILTIEPYELPTLRSGVNGVIHLLDELAVEKERQDERENYAHYEDDTIDAAERYLMKVLVWLNRLHSDADLGEYQDIRDVLQAKFA